MPTTKMPQILVKNELNNNELIRKNYPMGEIDNKSTLTSFRDSYPYVFDGLSCLLSNIQAINGHHKDYFNPDGGEVDIIERKDAKHELYYRSTIPIEAFYRLCLGSNNLDQSQALLKQLLKLNDESGTKIIFYYNDAGQLIMDKTKPIRVSFQYVTGRTLTARELQFKQNFANNDRSEGKAHGGENGALAFITIEYHKGLFQDLLHQNENGSLGWKYFKVAPHFQANLISTIKELLSSKFFDTYKGGTLSAAKAPLIAHDARELYFLLLNHNNDVNDTIEIPTLQICKECEGFGSYITRYTTKAGQVVESVPKGRGFDLRAKIEKIIVTMKLMAIRGNMDGSILLPYELDENRVSYDTEKEVIRIKVKRPDKYLHYDVKQLPPLNPEDATQPEQ